MKDHSKCCASTGIHDGITFGQGELDNNGYWQYPCYECARKWEAEYPNEKAWPFKDVVKEPTSLIQALDAEPTEKLRELLKKE